MKEDILYFIEFINDLVDDEFMESIGYVRAKDYFQSGGCYEFACILSHYLPQSKMMIRHDLKHLAIFYNGNIYDSYGLLKKQDFRDLQALDYSYIEDEAFYGRLEIRIEGRKPSDVIIKKKKKCRIGPLLEKIKQ